MISTGNELCNDRATSIISLDVSSNKLTYFVAYPTIVSFPRKVNGILIISFGTIFDGELCSLIFEGDEGAWDGIINVAMANIEPFRTFESGFHDSFKSGIGYSGSCVPGASVVRLADAILFS